MSEVGYDMRESTLPFFVKAVTRYFSHIAGLPAEAEQGFTRELREKFHPQQPVRAIFAAPSPRG